MRKAANLAKATFIVCCGCVAIGILALLFLAGKLAKDLLLMLLAIILPVVIVALAVLVTYRYLEYQAGY